MTADRIDYDKMTGLVNARPDRGTRHALYTALTGINDAERTMGENITALRAALDDAETYLHATRTHADSSRIQRAATDLDHASRTRNLHWATAAALLTEDEMRQLTTPPAGH